MPKWGEKDFGKTEGIEGIPAKDWGSKKNTPDDDGPEKAREADQAKQREMKRKADERANWGGAAKTKTVRKPPKKKTSGEALGPYGAVAKYADAKRRAGDRLAKYKHDFNTENADAKSPIAETEMKRVDLKGKPRKKRGRLHRIASGFGRAMRKTGRGVKRAFVDKPEAGKGKNAQVKT
jgi:hypothetical protein